MSNTPKTTRNAGGVHLSRDEKNYGWKRAKTILKGTNDDDLLDDLLSDALNIVFRLLAVICLLFFLYSVYFAIFKIWKMDNALIGQASLKCVLTIAVSAFCFLPFVGISNQMKKKGSISLENKIALLSLIVSVIAIVLA